MLFVLAVGILLDGIYNLVGYLCRWRHIYLCYQSMCHTKMTPSRIEWDRMTKRMRTAFLLLSLLAES